MKIYLFLLPPLPSRDGRGGGVVATPLPQPFSRQTFLNFFIDKWLSGLRVGKSTKWQSWRESKNGTRENPKEGEDVWLRQPPTEREG